MFQNLPLDIKAESLLAYVPRDKRRLEIRGAHKRNAYEDIADISDDEDGISTISLSRNGMYDILPECLFHPIDRFDNIPANEYKERFKEECEQQRQEEDNARKYFQPFDTFLFEISTSVNDMGNNGQIDSLLSDIICDSFPQQYKDNRFIRKAKEFIPRCKNIRGNKGLFTMMLRHILFDECITINEHLEATDIKDQNPRYNFRLDATNGNDESLFLGNNFDEDITVYDIQYWNENECSETFLTFISEIKTFEKFLNEYFMSIECSLRFDISTISLPVRLSDDICFNYLDYNTNI